MNANLKPFTLHDWEAFAGAWDLPDGTPPLLGTVHDWIIIVSGTEGQDTVVNVQMIGPGGPLDFPPDYPEDQLEQVWSKDFPSIAAAVAVVTGAFTAPSSDGVATYAEAIGFEQIN